MTIEIQKYKDTFFLLPTIIFDWEYNRVFCFGWLIWNIQIEF